METMAPAISLMASTEALRADLGKPIKPVIIIEKIITIYLFLINFYIMEAGLEPATFYTQNKRSTYWTTPFFFIYILKELNLYFLFRK